MAGSSATAQFSATSVAAKAISGDQNSPSIVQVENTGAADVYVGYSSAVTTTTGYLIASTKTASIALDVGEDLYAVTASGTAQLYLARSRALQRNS